VSAFLEKPIDVSVLLKAIEHLLEEPIEARLRKITRHLQGREAVPIF
jgi:hypothetical protein